MIEGEEVQQVSTNAVVVNGEGKVLMVKRAENEDFLPGFWELPGGGSEYGETPQDACIREVDEECGVKIEVGKPISVHCYMMGKVQRVEITFVCRLTEEDEVLLSVEHSDYRWVDRVEAKNLMVSEMIGGILEKYWARADVD